MSVHNKMIDGSTPTLESPQRLVAKAGTFGRDVREIDQKCKPFMQK